MAAATGYGGTCSKPGILIAESVSEERTSVASLSVDCEDTRLAAQRGLSKNWQTGKGDEMSREDRSQSGLRPLRVLALRVMGDPILRTPCADVTDFGQPLKSLVADMFEAMYRHNGVGLAANQVGVGLRIFVYDCPDDLHMQHKGHFINPELRIDTDEISMDQEGCLSVPGVFAACSRPMRVTVSGFDWNNEPIELQAEGFLARCMSHEVDHLKGRLYTDHLLGEARRVAFRQMR